MPEVIKSIILKAKSVSNLGDDLAFSAALALDDGSKEIPATFAIDTDDSTLPMIGITQYGKLVGLPSSESTPFTVTATPLDGSEATIVYTNVVDVIEADIGASISST